MVGHVYGFFLIMDSQQDSSPSASVPMDTEPISSNDPNVKPALKKAAEIPSGDRKDRHLKWDEEVIEEHDKLRGTRMKIDEPNTPFAHYDSGGESEDSGKPKSPNQNREALSWDVLQNKLDSVAAVRAQFPSSPSSHADVSDHDSVAEEERKKEMKKMEFQEHRKRHYNEMEALRRFRQQHRDDTDEEDSDADDES